MIIGLSGYAQVGKDTIGAHLVENYGFTRHAFADALKQVAMAVDPWVYVEWGFVTDEAHALVCRRLWGSHVRLSRLIDLLGPDGAKQLPDVRKFYQDLGVGMRKHVYDGVWVDAVMRKIDGAPWDAPVTPYVITDVRFPDELAAIRERGGEIWRIVRAGSEPANDHISEHALDGERFDRTIKNDATVDALTTKTDLIMERMNR